MYCQKCGAKLSDNAAFCDQCGVKVGEPGVDSGSIDREMASIIINKKSEALALILSLLIPGLGEIYVGKIRYGVFAFVIWIAAITALVLCYVMEVVRFAPITLYFVTWIISMYNAFTFAKEYNKHLLDNNGNPPW